MEPEAGRDPTVIRQNRAEQEIISRLRTEGWEVHARGWPDLLCIKDGIVRAIEVKPFHRTRKGPMSRAQARVAEILGAAGIQVELIRASCVGRAEGHAYNPDPQLLDQITAGGAIIHYSIDRRRLLVHVPPHPSFKGHAVSLGGRFRKRDRVWSFHIGRVDAVQNLIQQMFGPLSDVPGGGGDVSS